MSYNEFTPDYVKAVAIAEKFVDTLFHKVLDKGALTRELATIIYEVRHNGMMDEMQAWEQDTAEWKDTISKLPSNTTWTKEEVVDILDCVDNCTVPDDNYKK